MTPKTFTPPLNVCSTILTTLKPQFKASRLVATSRNYLQLITQSYYITGVDEGECVEGGEGGYYGVVAPKLGWLHPLMRHS